MTSQLENNIVKISSNRGKKMFIQTESTPNPSTLKFVPGQAVMEVGTADFASETAAQNSPLAQRIFQVTDVTGVFSVLTS